MRWIVLKRVGEATFENLGVVETKDMQPDASDWAKRESEAVRQRAEGAGVFAVVPFDHWSLHATEARIVSHPIPRGGEIRVEPEDVSEQVMEEPVADEDMDGLVRPGGQLP